MNGVAVAFASQAVLGESPVWSASTHRLLWVDTLGASLNLFDPITGKNDAYVMPSPLGFVAETPAGQWIIGSGCHVESVSRSGERQRIATAPHNKAVYRFNDASLDPFGRLWVGLMNEALTEGSGYLYRLDPDGTWHTVDSGFTLINGIDWSRDRSTLYVTDSRKGVIYAYDHDSLSGEVRNRRSLISISPDKGKPDGLTVDREGFLLSVLFDGAAIARISPEGNTASTIALPVPRPTSCAFDATGQYLFVTSARLGLSKSEIASAPASGALLRIDYQQVTG
ncbi:SMP-30/gluconolactonase/LRE family protein [Halomonas sp. SpR1]|uniref:SMP-30/gluconolactonase/LRE family protein n=1 Tax=Halomonas sp. SpR1 TaxID=3050462 RepID=UPI0027E471B7|nr:SMP-30/gluconolactonase/LRE family protein [Halomonas sp. SpR1]MDQ7734029.1 SMP-30/gluconolactonase/LRE family protein [Halomonas sp. SpR1]